MLAKTAAAMMASATLFRRKPGIKGTRATITSTWKTSAVANISRSENGATIARRIGRSSALAAPIAMTAAASAMGESMVNPGRSAAVAASEMLATTKLTTARHSSWRRPRRQFQISSIWTR
jgi:hypothetical protein